MKVAVIGNGLLGKEIVKLSNWDCISRSTHDFDFRDITTLYQYIKDYDIIINCVAHTDTYSNERELHWAINYKAVSRLADWCNENDKKLVHISTDYVYSNSVQYAKETDVPVHNPTWYGYSKALADGYIENFSNDYLICRMTHKPKPFPYDKAWVNQIGNFDYVDKQVKRLVDLIKLNASGIMNVGREVVSMYELAKETKENVEQNECDYPVPSTITMNINRMKGIINESN